MFEHNYFSLLNSRLFFGHPFGGPACFVLPIGFNDKQCVSAVPMLFCSSVILSLSMVIVMMECPMKLNPSRFSGDIV